MWKWTKRIVLVVILLLIIGGVILYFSLNGIIRSQVEQQSTKSLNLQTSLASASVGLFSGDVSLRDYKVASPPGFSSQPMMELGGLDVKVGYSELRGTPVKVQNITIDRPKLLLEQKGGKFNIKAMTDNLPQNQQSPTPPPTGEPAPPTPPQPTEPPAKPGEPAPPADTMKVMITLLTVKDPEVIIRPGIPGVAEEIPVKIGTFEMKNIGNADGNANGVAVKEVVTQLVSTMAAKASNSAGLPAELKALLDGNLNEIAQKYLPGEAGKIVGSLLNEQTLKDPGKAIGSALENATGGATTNPAKAVGQVLEGVTGEGKKPEDALKGLLGGKKDDKKKDEKKKEPK